MSKVGVNELSAEEVLKRIWLINKAMDNSQGTFSNTLLKNQNNEANINKAWVTLKEKYTDVIKHDITDKDVTSVISTKKFNDSELSNARKDLKILTDAIATSRKDTRGPRNTNPYTGMLHNQLNGSSINLEYIKPRLLTAKTEYDTAETARTTAEAQRLASRTASASAIQKTPLPAVAPSAVLTPPTTPTGTQPLPTPVATRPASSSKLALDEIQNARNIDGDNKFDFDARKKEILAKLQLQNQPPQTLPLPKRDNKPSPEEMARRLKAQQEEALLKAREEDLAKRKAAFLKEQEALKNTIQNAVLRARQEALAREEAALRKQEEALRTQATLQARLAALQEAPPRDGAHSGTDIPHSPNQGMPPESYQPPSFGAPFMSSAPFNPNQGTWEKLQQSIKENRHLIVNKNPDPDLNTTHDLATQLCREVGQLSTATDFTYLDKGIYKVPEGRQPGPVFMARVDEHGKPLLVNGKPHPVDVLYYGPDGKLDLKQSFIAPNNVPQGSKPSVDEKTLEKYHAAHEEEHNKRQEQTAGQHQDTSQPGFVPHQPPYEKKEVQQAAAAFREATTHPSSAPNPTATQKATSHHPPLIQHGGSSGWSHS